MILTTIQLHRAPLLGAHCGSPFDRLRSELYVVRSDRTQTYVQAHVLCTGLVRTCSKTIYPRSVLLGSWLNIQRSHTYPIPMHSSPSPKLQLERLPESSAEPYGSGRPC